MGEGWSSFLPLFVSFIIFLSLFLVVTVAVIFVVVVLFAVTASVPASEALLPLLRLAASRVYSTSRPCRQRSTGGGGLGRWGVGVDISGY